MSFDKGQVRKKSTPSPVLKSCDSSNKNVLRKSSISKQARSILKNLSRYQLTPG